MQLTFFIEQVEEDLYTADSGKMTETGQPVVGSGETEFDAVIECARKLKFFELRRKTLQMWAGENSAA